MFVRFRQSARRLQLSLVENRRLGGRIRHEHVASLGSVLVPPSVADRIAYWQQLDWRLQRLSNRLDAETQAKILGAVHARIPLPTPDEQRALQLENAEADKRVWSAFAEMVDGQIAGEKELGAKVERSIADAEKSAAEIKSNLADAEDRIARLNKGETIVGGLAKPLDFVAILRNAGWSKADIEHCRRVGALSEAEFEEAYRFDVEDLKRRERRAVNAILRRRYSASPRREKA